MQISTLPCKYVWKCGDEFAYDIVALSFFLLSHSAYIVWSARRPDNPRDTSKNSDIEGSLIVSAFSDSGKFDFVAEQDFLSNHITLY